MSLEDLQLNGTAININDMTGTGKLFVSAGKLYMKSEGTLGVRLFPSLKIHTVSETSVCKVLDFKLDFPEYIPESHAKIISAAETSPGDKVMLHGGTPGFIIGKVAGQILACYYNGACVVLPPSDKLKLVGCANVAVKSISGADPSLASSLNDLICKGLTANPVD